MPAGTYLSWVTEKTRTRWWHDSAEAAEIERGLARGAVGITTNPYLTNLALVKNRDRYAPCAASIAASKPASEAWAEALTQLVATATADRCLPMWEQTGGRHGWVCAQVNPARAGDRDAMLPMARRFHQWRPNIAVKLPATAAGLDVLEECVAEGITAAATVSFTVPQAIAVAERARRGAQRARANGVEPGKSFAVIMIGRLDDFLREIAQDVRAGLDECVIRQAGLAVTKRSLSLYREHDYDTVILVAAMRGVYHLTELAGADAIMSIAPALQELFVNEDLAREERHQLAVPPAVIEQLRRLPEFVRAYEPDGMQPEQFAAYGVTQRTLGQFCDAGWKLIAAYQP